MHNNLRLLILFGGKSTEHEVSRASTASILKMIDRNKYEIICIGIDKEGKWFLTEASIEEIFNGSWESKPNNKRAFLSPDSSVHGIVLENKAVIKVDCVWPVLHGKNGEDGTIQGLCELAGLKYVGPDVCSSAMCMDKAVTKLIVKHTNIKQADCYIVDNSEYLENKNMILQKIEEYFYGNYPLFVKPSVSGSSVGISKVYSRSELIKAFNVAFNESTRVLVEEAIIGQEVEVAVLGNENAKTSRAGEILVEGQWYDYESKYGGNSFKTIVPANIDPKVETEIQKSALKIYKIMGCKGLSRIDFFVTKDGEVIFNEINTLPGFTQISMYPKLWEATGLEYTDLLDKIISYAME